MEEKLADAYNGCQCTKHTHAAANGPDHAAAHNATVHAAIHAATHNAAVHTATYAARSRCNRLCSLPLRFTSPLQFCDNMVAICRSDKWLHV